MTNPKELKEKIGKFQNDSFSTWMQKTNVSANEIGDLNKISSVLLNELHALTLRPGQVSGVVGGKVLTGVLTNFLTSASVGDVIEITISSSPLITIERRVLEIGELNQSTGIIENTNTKLIVDSPFEQTFNNVTYKNLRSLSLVSSINYLYDSESRRTLIRSIAMS